MTQTVDKSKSKDSKESKIAYSKVTTDPPKKSKSIAVNLDDQGDKVVIQKDSRDVFIYLVSVIISIFIFYLMYSMMQPNVLQHVNVLMLDINDQRAIKVGNKSAIFAAEPKENGNGTRVLVYDGKQKYVTWPDPPPKEKLASVARYILHISEFGSLATESTHKGIEGYPFVNIFSISDGPFNKSTGTPYFYFTPLELSVIDLKANNKASITLTEAQSDYCNKKLFDPEDPRCAHVIFTGEMGMIAKDSEEEEFARNSLFSRHVEMKSWPSNHAWFFAKMNIKHIYLLDFFGGAKVVDVDEYFAANPFESKKEE